MVSSVAVLLGPLSEVEFHTRRRGPHLGSLELESATEIRSQTITLIFPAAAQFERRPSCSLPCSEFVDYTRRTAEMYFDTSCIHVMSNLCLSVFYVFKTRRNQILLGPSISMHCLSTSNSCFNSYCTRAAIWYLARYKAITADSPHPIWITYGVFAEMLDC
jgi:hypothetical protein